MTARRNTTTTTATPGVQARADLIGAQLRRHHAKYRLVRAYSHKTRKDVVLLGRPSLEMFLLLEATPQLHVVDHLHICQQGPQGGDALRQVIVSGNPNAYLLHILAGGDSESARESIVDSVRHDMRLSSRARAELCIHERQDLLARDVLLVNWLRLNAYLAAAKTFSLQVFRETVLRRINRGEVRDVGDLLSVLALEEAALHLAAMAELIQEGKVVTDIDVKPFCRSTLIGTRK